MAKKMFCANARLVKGKRWYIDYNQFDPETNQVTRHRKDFNLNDVSDELVREQVAKVLMSNLEHLARPVATTTSQDKTEASGDNLKKCVEYALAEKLTSPRRNTHKGYKSIVGCFLKWAQSRGYADKGINTFTKVQARAFFHWLKTRKQYRSTTLNNYLIHLRAIWNYLIEEEMCAKNPFKHVKLAPDQEKLRRVFNADEKRIVAEYIREKDYWLYRALLLQYYGYIRPIEIARLKFKAFDLAAGTVKIESWEAKKWKPRVVTLPKSIMPFFRDGIFDRQPANYYMLGSIDKRVVAPSPEPAHENRQYTRHRKHLETLKKMGKLENIKGLTWYSWKDTGISAHIKDTSPMATRDQAGHTDFNMTLIYYSKDRVNEEYRDLKHDLA